MFSDKEKAFAVEHYLKTGSFKKAALKFRQHYKTRHNPSKQRIYEWTDKFRLNQQFGCKMDFFMLSCFQKFDPPKDPF